MATKSGKYKIPKNGNEEEAQAIAGIGKRNLSKSGSGWDSSLAPNNKNKWGDSSKETFQHPENISFCRHSRGAESHQGGANQASSDASGSYRAERKNRSGNGHFTDRSSSQSCKPKDNFWNCPQCGNCNFIKSYQCIKCNLPQKYSANYTPIGNKKGKN